MCLGRFSAVTFQVLGHTKTVLVLLISWLALHEPMSARKLAGMGLAVAGMVAYGHYNGRAAAGKAPDALPLLAKARQTSDGDVGWGRAGRRGGWGRPGLSRGRGRGKGCVLPLARLG